MHIPHTDKSPGATNLVVSGDITSKLEMSYIFVVYNKYGG